MLILFALLGCLPLPAMNASQDGEPAPPQAELPEIVVTAPALTSETPFRVIGTVPGVGSEAPSIPRTLGDALVEVPGVGLQRTSYGQASPFLRGFTGFRTLTLVDGIRLNHSVFRDGPNQYVQLVDPLMLESADVVFGPASVEYGSDAVGGAVLLHTTAPQRSGAEPISGGRIWARTASAEQSSVTRLESWYGSQRVAVRGGGSYRDYGDFTAGRHEGLQPGAGYREWSGDVSAATAIGESVEVILAVQAHEQSDVPRTHSTVDGSMWRGTVPGTDFQRDLDLERELEYVKLLWDPVATRGAELTFSRQRISEEEDRIRANGRQRIQGFDDVAWGTSANWWEQTSIGTWSFGIDYTQEGVNSDFIEFNTDGSVREVRPRGPVADRSRYDLFGLHVEDQFPVSDSVDLKVGGRYTYAHVDAKDVDPDPSAAVVFGPIHESWSNVVGSVHAVWNVDPKSSIFGGISQAFRAPNLSDLTRFDAARSGEAEIPAAGLDPEEFLTLELGSRIDLDPVTLEGSVWHTFIDGLIVRFPTGAVNADGDDIVTKENSGSGDATGADIGVRVHINEEVDARAAFTWVEGVVEQTVSPGIIADEPLSRLPPARGTLRLRYRPQGAPLELECGVTIASRQDRLSASDEADTERIPSGGTPGYVVYDACLAWRPTERLRLFLELGNIFNKDYRLHGSGQNELGTNVAIGAELRF